jgi:hypothetical protein
MGKYGMKKPLKKSNPLTLVSKLTKDVEVVEKNFDELVSILKEKKIRAFSCIAITLDGEVINHFDFDTDSNFFSLVGATEIVKNNIIKENTE